MFKHALLAISFFGLGVLVRDVAQDHKAVLLSDIAAKECKADKEKAARYAGALVHLLNRGTVMVGSTSMSCRVKEDRS